MILRIFICIFSIKVHQLAEGAPTPLDPGGEWPGHIPGQVRQSPGQVEPKQGGLPTFWPLATTTTTRGGLGMSSHCLTTRFMPESIATESQRWSFYKSIRSLMMLKRRRTHAHTCVHKDPIDKLANKCFSFMFPGFMQPVRGKRMLARRVRERMRGVFRDGSTHVARRLWSACSNLEDIAHEWPTTTIRRPLAKPLTNLDQSSSPDLISPLPHLII